MAYCDEYVELISAAIDGALSPAQRERLEEHLASCPECKALYEELTALHAALSDLPPVEVPADLTERIMAAVAAEQVIPLEKKAPVRWQRWLASAAVLAVVVAGAWSWKPWEHDLKSKGLAPAAAPAAQQVMPAASNEDLPEGAVATEAEEAATESVLMYTVAGEAPAPVFPANHKSAAESSENAEDAQMDILLPTAAEDTPAEALEESGGIAPQMSRMTAAPANGGEPALPTEAPEEDEVEEAVPEPEPQPLMTMDNSFPIQTADAAKALTAQEALDLVVERCFGDSGYEMFREDLEGDIPSCYVSLMDNGVLVTDGTIVYTGETEDFFLFECHWGDIPEEPYHYSVHKTEGYVAWQGEAPIDGEFRP